VTTDKHLTKDALVLLATGNYSQSLRREAIGHFKSCNKCLREFGEVRKVLSSVQAASELGLLASPRKLQVKQSRLFRYRTVFPWAPIATIVTASIVVIFTILVPRAVPTASASELLDRAVTNEHRLGAPVAVNFLTHGIKCGHGKTGSEFMLLKGSPECQKVTNSMKSAAWSTRNPLSASSFQAWHASLADHRDAVKKLPAVWTIETSTSTGAIRDARFTLRQDTYQPLELYLQFSDEEEITIKEDTTPSPEDSIANTAVPIGTRLSTVSLANDPADVLEVQAWQILHDLNGDTGWEARIVRSGRSVKVEAQVISAARKEEFENAFEPYPKIVRDIHEYGEPGTRPNFLPYRGPNISGGPPLAREWLEQQFQNPTERSQFVTKTVNLSKSILGQASILEELKARRSVISNCSCARTLDGLIQKQKTSLLAAQNSLRFSLEPLVGTPQQAVPRRITAAVARRLDTAVLTLLFATPPNNTIPLDQGKNVIRQLL
jgi:hypothetical protein